MGFVSKIGDILMLDEGKNYYVINQVEYNNVSYLIVAEVGVDLDMIINMEKNAIVVKEVVDDNDDYFLTIVEDKALSKKIMDLAK